MAVNLEAQCLNLNYKDDFSKKVFEYLDQDDTNQNCLSLKVDRRRSVPTLRDETGMGIPDI